MLAETEDTDQVDDVVETKEVVIKAFRSSQQPTSTARGSNDPGPVEGPAEEPLLCLVCPRQVHN
jgi:hypothetical protein